jgi:glycosyltransferase involved in cell wall biosynthesis
VMKATIINCFDTYEDRVDLIHEFFMGKGYDVTVIQSDFRHFKKVPREDMKEGFMFVKSNPYYKNLSVARLTSHYKYAKDAFKIVGDLKPDLIYVFVPPNSLAKFAAKYKQKNKDIKLIYDLIDLWPETMPIGKAKSFPPFSYWGAMRDHSLKYADLLITECNLYQTVLGNAIKDIKTETVHLAKKEIEVISELELREDEIHLAYLGSINNIIDIQKIKEIIQVINKLKPVTLHIIGDGESKEELIGEVKSAGAVVEYHGKIYDSQKKQDIFDKCHFGLNIMKENVCVGLTMKSIDYFQHGLPIINNIPADTAEIVEEFGIGVNIKDSKDLGATLSEITSLNNEALIDMRKTTLSIYKKLFSIEAYFKKVESVYKEHINI